MSPDSANESSLVAALADADAPAYLVDENRVITFANRALEEWTGLAAEQLLGGRVAYHSEPPEDEGARLLTGLCPTPVAMAGQRATGSVSCAGGDGRQRSRSAEFLPLPSSGGEEADGGCPVLVVCERQDLAFPPRTTATSDADPNRLHTALARFRETQASRSPPPALLGDGVAATALRRGVDAAVASGANALVTGQPGAGRADVAREVFTRSSTGPSSRLLPLEGALLEGSQVAERVAAACRVAADAAVTLLVQNADALSEPIQRGLAEAVGSAPGLRLLATAASADSIADEGLRRMASTIVLPVPAVADRGDDLPLLVQWCVERENREGGRQVAGVASDALEQLALYSWPGEIAELRAVIATAHARSRSAMITVADLPTVIRQAALAAELPPSKPTPIVLDQFLGRIERELVDRALQQSGGSKAEAARLLGLTRPRLYRLLERLGVPGAGPENSGRDLQNG